MSLVVEKGPRKEKVKRVAATVCLPTALRTFVRSPFQIHWIVHSLYSDKCPENPAMGVVVVCSKPCGGLTSEFFVSPLGPSTGHAFSPT